MDKGFKMLSMYSHPQIESGHEPLLHVIPRLSDSHHFLSALLYAAYSTSPN